MSKLLTIGVISQSSFKIPRDGLIGEWLFSGNAKDTSGNGWNGTVSGATLMTDKKGVANSAYYFDGNDNIKTSQPSITQGADFSISFWFKKTATGIHSLICNGITTNSRYVYSYGNYINFQIYEGGYTGAQRKAIRSSELSLETWYHCVCVYESGVQNIYVNKSLDKNASTNYQSAKTTGGTSFGFLDRAGGENYLAGNLDNIRIYNRALKQIEINNLFAEL